eukprot:6182051-Pleurochrysis_carterae.AAC.10
MPNNFTRYTKTISDVLAGSSADSTHLAKPEPVYFSCGSSLACTQSIAAESANPESQPTTLKLHEPHCFERSWRYNGKTTLKKSSATTST